MDDAGVVPLLEGSKVETFSEYIARQMGFDSEHECPQLIELAVNYLKKSKDADLKIYEYLENEPNAQQLYGKFVEEFERCILAYFSFHWSRSQTMISQAKSLKSDKKKPKDLVLAATRKQRFDNVFKNLKVTRVFSTLVDEMKALGRRTDDLSQSAVMAPVALSERSPVLLLMGGGMGAGKSTVLQNIKNGSFWSSTAQNAVVVEADAFKQADVIYQALSSRGPHQDMLLTAELVHQYSTDAASSLLVTALNEGRDVIMDGTLSWEPFVKQTIAMARKVHKHRYRMGEGYKDATQNYWVQVEGGNIEKSNRKPYRIELVGVVCDAYNAVVRGIRRAIETGSPVRVSSQLKYHKRFASAFPRYCQLVDSARLYRTDAVAGPPALIAWKDGSSKVLVDTEEIKCLASATNLNEEAESIYELYKEPEQINKVCSDWKDLLLVPNRRSVQLEIKNVAKKIETRVSVS